VSTALKTTEQQLAVDALIKHMPGTANLSSTPAAAPSPLPAAAASAILASWVGETSADLALVLLDPAFLSEASGSQTLVKPTDVLVPALQESAGVLGTGVLSEAIEGDAAPLFADPQAHIFELRVADDIIGWYLVRLRSEFAPVASAKSIEGRLSRLNEVEMTLTVEIGRTRMPIRNVLGLEVGTVVELDRAVGAPADVLLNGRLIALGEVVVVDQEFAVRITRILDGADTTAR
jgi:flagellar motor switch protein FliN/FliY